MFIQSAPAAGRRGHGATRGAMKPMAKNNAVYAQSGGVTAVINASAYGVITAAREADFIDEIYAGYDGINGILEENLIDLGKESAENIEALRHTPAGAMGFIGGLNVASATAVLLYHLTLPR